MYKYLLCWRYLRSRYIALASIISVTLGVATMIVVNSVMEGFSSEMQNRIHGILSDLVLEARSLDGLRDAAWHEDEIRRIAGDDIEAMSPTVSVPAMLTFEYGANTIVRQVQLIGIDDATQSQVSDFGAYLQHPENRNAMSFDLREGGYDVRDHQADPDVPERKQMHQAGKGRRHEIAKAKEFQKQYFKQEKPQPTDSATPPADPFAANQPPSEEPAFDPEKQNTGAVLGIAMAGYRTSEAEDKFYVVPGDDVKLTFPTVGRPPKASSDNFTIVDFYESKMSEYDARLVFVPIRKLQELRGMVDPTTGVASFNAIAIKLKPGVNLNAVRDKLRDAFPAQLYSVETWRDMQGPLLSAVELESRILNLLLFLIIAVAGFGILAIFYMIVVEKTRDIGVLKSLGASSHGVMGIFLGYGLLLGIVGSGIGMVLGLLFVRNINRIADGLAWITGQPVFDPSVYYFYKIPAVIVPQTVTWIVVGALAIAVAASILPARRAARLHPVEALRYE